MANVRVRVGSKTLHSVTWAKGWDVAWDAYFRHVPLPEAVWLLMEDAYDTVCGGWFEPNTKHEHNLEHNLAVHHE